MNHHQPSPHRQPTPCATFARLAPLLDAGELDAEREAWAREHLGTCAACRRRFAGYEIATAALRRHYGGMRPPVSLPNAEELMKIADREATHDDAPTPSRIPISPRSPLRRGWRPLATVLTAAMVLAVIGTLFALRGHSRPSTTGSPKTPKTPQTSGKVVEITLGGKLPSPTALAIGKDGAIWVLDPQKNAIGRIGVADPAASPPYSAYVWVAPTANAGLADIAVSSDGSVWFTESDANRIGRIIPNPTTSASTNTGSITEYKGPNSGIDGSPHAIVAGANGVMWYTALSSHPGYTNSIAPIHADGTITSILMQPYPDPGMVSITRTPDGAIWFTEANTGRIDRLDPVVFERDPRNSLKQFSLPQSASGPIAIAAAPDNSVWFLERGANTIGHMSPDGKVTQFPVPTGDHALSSLAVASDGSVWFTEAKANQIGHMSSSGSITDIAVPTPSAGLSDIAIAPDGKVWFTETASGKIGYVTP